MEELIKYKYSLIEIKDDLDLANHTTTKGFWEYCNDKAFLTFNKHNYTFNEIVKSNLCHFCAPQGSFNKYGCLIAQIYDRESFNKIVALDNIKIIEDIEEIEDFVSSQHYIFSTYLLNFLVNLNLTNLNIFEIGGGWGNMRRIISKLVSINSYTIFDIDSTLYFNKQFYKENINDYTLRLYENTNYFGSAFYNINLDFRDIYITNFNDSLDFLIATHSLSELDMNQFCWYYNNLIKKCNYFFYCTQVNDSNHNPVSGEISRQKITMIKNIMNVLIDIGQPGQESDCRLYIFKKK